MTHGFLTFKKWSFTPFLTVPSAAPLLRPVCHRPGHLRAGGGVRRAPPLAGQQLHMWRGGRGLRVHPGHRRPFSPGLHLRGSGRLRGHHRHPHALLPAADRAEPAPGAGVHRGRLRHVEAPLPGVLRGAPDRLACLQAVAEGLTGGRPELMLWLWSGGSGWRTTPVAW